MAGPDAKKSFLLRIDPQLWDKLQALAAEDLRSINGEIEYLLREALVRRGRLSLVNTSTEEAQGDK